MRFIPPFSLRKAKSPKQPDSKETSQTCDKKAESKPKPGEADFTRGKELYDEKKYAEAEIAFQKSAEKREKALGPLHVDTLRSVFKVAHTLYYQKRYPEAETLFRELILQQEATIGPEHYETLNSKYELAGVLYREEKYPEAEALFRESLEQRERLQGVNHEDTLSSKYELGFILRTQAKHVEAEKVFRELSQQRESVLGPEHKDTLAAKFGLAKTLNHQRKFTEAAEVLFPLSLLQEKVLGKDHKDTKACIKLLGGIALSNAWRDSAKSTAQAGKLADILRPDGIKRESRYTASEIQQVSLLLADKNAPWSKVPRLYIILRRIEASGYLDTLIDLGIDDEWFPFMEGRLPTCLPPNKRVEFMAEQRLVVKEDEDAEQRGEGAETEKGKEDDEVTIADKECTSLLDEETKKWD